MTRDGHCRWVISRSLLVMLMIIHGLLVEIPYFNDKTLLISRNGISDTTAYWSEIEYRPYDPWL